MYIWLTQALTIVYFDYIEYTVCPGSSDPFYIVTYYMKSVTTSWTYNIQLIQEKSSGI